MSPSCRAHGIRSKSQCGGHARRLPEPSPGLGEEIAFLFAASDLFGNDLAGESPYASSTSRLMFVELGSEIIRQRCPYSTRAQTAWTAGRARHEELAGGGGESGVLKGNRDFTRGWMSQLAGNMHSILAEQAIVR